MTTEPVNPEVHQEEDRLSVPALLAILVAALLAGGGAVLWSGLTLEAELPPVRERAVPEALTAGRRPREIGMIEQTLITSDFYGLRLHASKRRVLESYGWVDRPHGIARIPIDRAMEIVAQEGR